MSKQFFLDTNFIVSYLDKSDSLHKRARMLFKEFNLLHSQIFFSDITLNEVFSVLARRAKEKKISFKVVVKHLKTMIYKQPVLCLYEIFNQNFKNVLFLMKRLDGKLNFHDCLMALFLKEVPKVKLISFDKGFDLIPYIQRIS